MKQDPRPRHYWDLSVISAYVLQDKLKLGILQKACDHSNHGQNSRLFTSVLVPSLLLNDPNISTPDIEEKLKALIHGFCEQWGARVERIACHELVADRVGPLLYQARANQLDLSVDTAIELATAAWLGVTYFETFKEEKPLRDLKKVAEIAKLTFPILSPFEVADQELAKEPLYRTSPIESNTLTEATAATKEVASTNTGSSTLPTYRPAGRSFLESVARSRSAAKLPAKPAKSK